MSSTGNQNLSSRKGIDRTVLACALKQPMEDKARRARPPEDAVVPTDGRGTKGRTALEESKFNMSMRRNKKLLEKVGDFMFWLAVVLVASAFLLYFLRHHALWLT